ncbi:hypothetical protein H0H81_007219 [Sphagnurus paluster]|uniref:MnmG N-terminal domain-containing protein n=1 Tax=Sphagnurus paluster TaxID=117069 RepID=A0A9P7GNN2_9AGAR|nr:hypothetical protein H0H81_007219 [Sphagnurus paluster]
MPVDAGKNLVLGPTHTLCFGVFLPSPHASAAIYLGSTQLPPHHTHSKVFHQSPPQLPSSSTAIPPTVCVIGGGHAGCEAATGAARAGARTVLLTQKIETIGELSCNPSIGGVGKGTLVREVDALDGVMARVADQAGIQFHILNRSKGAAVWGPRAQIDRTLYKRNMQETLHGYPNLTIKAGSVFDLVIDHSDSASSGQWGSIVGVKLDTELFVPGLKTFPAGRINDAPSIGLSASLKAAGFKLGRLQTGTPARLDGTTIDFSGMEQQLGDAVPSPFSYLNREVPNAVCPGH